MHQPFSVCPTQQSFRFILVDGAAMPTIKRPAGAFIQPDAGLDRAPTILA
jgi:hypothetical protein